MEVKVFEGENPNVKKYVFIKEDAVYESVVYKYPEYKERTVICCSVMSGCPVGCIFCGTGKRYIRPLTKEEIVFQIEHILTTEHIDSYVQDINKFQIMFMSMGEPMLNWEQVKESIILLNKWYPKAQLLLSTMGVKDDKVFLDMVDIATKINKVGLQFSLHNSIDVERHKLIPFNNKYTIREIRDRGLLFYKETGRKPYINYCVTEENDSQKHIDRMLDLFPPMVFCFTFSVICNADRNNKQDQTDYKGLKAIEQIFIENGYDVRIFDPAGKDDIGGGCGQLWFVQEWLKKKQEGNN